jgi:hypothetical protein
MRFMADKVALGQVSIQVFQFPLSVLFHQYSILICFLTLLLSKHAGKVWEPSNKAMPFEILDST